MVLLPQYLKQVAEIARVGPFHTLHAGHMAMISPYPWNTQCLTSHPSSVHERWNASLWAPLILKPLKKGIQISPISRAASAAIWEWSPVAEKAQQPLETCVSHGGLGGCLVKGNSLSVSTALPAKIPSFLWPGILEEKNLKRGPHVHSIQCLLWEYSSCIPAEFPETVCIYLIGITWPEHKKRGPVITPASSPIRRLSQTAHSASQTVPAICCCPPTMSRRIRDEGQIQDHRPSCPSCGTLT